MSIFITETQPVCFWPACSGLWGWWRKYEHHFMKIMWTSSVLGFNASPGETSLLFWPRRVDFCCWSQFWNGEALWSPFFWQGELPLCCFLHFLVGKKWHKLSAQRLCLLQLALWGVCAWHLRGVLLGVCLMDSMCCQQVLKSIPKHLWELISATLSPVPISHSGFLLLFSLLLNLEDHWKGGAETFRGWKYQRKSWNSDASNTASGSV